MKAKKILSVLQSFVTNICRSPKWMPRDLLVYGASIYQTLRECMPEQQVDLAFGNLFLHRFVIRAILDPTSYGILQDVPTDFIHHNLNILGLVLKKWSCAQLFTEAEAYMMQFNNLLTDFIVMRSGFIADITEGAAFALKDESYRISDELFDDSIHALYDPYRDYVNSE